MLLNFQKENGLRLAGQFSVLKNCFGKSRPVGNAIGGEFQAHLGQDHLRVPKQPGSIRSAHSFKSDRLKRRFASLHSIKVPLITISFKTESVENCSGWGGRACQGRQNKPLLCWPAKSLYKIGVISLSCGRAIAPDCSSPHEFPQSRPAPRAAAPLAAHQYFPATVASWWPR